MFLPTLEIFKRHVFITSALSNTAPGTSSYSPIISIISNAT